MNPLPKVAVVVLNWNGAGLLQQFLPSVLASTYQNMEVYVADNNSSDNSVALLKEQFKQVKIVQNRANFGFAGGYNEALAHISADYYVLLNSDVEVTPDWIEPVIDLMETDAHTAACQPKILNYHQKTHFEYAGAAGGWLDALGYAFCRGRFFNVCEPDNGQYNTTSEVFWASGCALFIKANLFHAFGGFDHYFFAHMEEIDLCWRLKRAGYRIMACPKSVVYHIGGGSLHKSNPRKTFLNYHNNLVLLYKNCTAVKLIWLLPVRTCLDWVSGLKLLAEGNKPDAMAILKAQWYFFSGIAKWQQNRRHTGKIVQENRLAGSKYPNLQGLYAKSIIVQHFLLRKSAFSQLNISKTANNTTQTT